MNRFRMILNGVDFSTAFNKWAVQFYSIKVEGPNSGISMDGMAIIDLVSVKDHFELPGNAVPERVFQQLSTICRGAYVTAEYIHPETGQAVAKVMIPAMSAANRLPMKGHGIYYDGWTLSLEER